MGTATINGELWGAKAREWADIQEPFVKPLWLEMLEVANVGSSDRVLDVACGSGHLALLANERGANVCGIDASDALVEIAKSRVHGTFEAGEMEEIPFEDESFDVVMICNGLQYAADREQAARELRRVLKNTGRLVVGMWAESSKCDMTAVFAKAKSLAPPPPNAPVPIDLAERGNLVSLLESQGLRVISDGEVACPFAYKNAAEYWAGQRSAGVLEHVARRAGEAQTKAAILEAAVSFTKSDGSIVFNNYMRYVLATKD